MRKPLFTILLIGCFFTTFAQKNPLQLQVVEKEFGTHTAKVYQIDFPAASEVAINFAEAFKQAFKVDTKTWNDQISSDAFEMPYTESNATLKAWTVSNGDTTTLYATLDFQKDGMLSREKFATEDSLLRCMLKQFNFNHRKDYYEARINELQKFKRHRNKRNRDEDNLAITKKLDSPNTLTASNHHLKTED
ncbi:hypothetical protein [Luteibaculum oceani]|uniref:Uncharacterized protein n=1 Tax=Luteibaculum oceani TaxID=1294296 RepID=A0A5C6VKL0_9FLAO|nr:hypothetical protein [Luteibaculum oceani]TXC85214.1 hypothetical protein FRX97_00910 [Luteibaculum oceani]